MPKWQRWKNIMKAYPFEEKRLAKWEPPYIVQPKFDGFRCRAVPIPSGFMLISSEGNAFFSVPHIEESLNKAEHLREYELDGELYNHRIYMEGGFNAIDSICSRTKNLHPDHLLMQFHIFDYVSDEPMAARAIRLNHLMDKGVPLHCHKSPYWVCNNLEEIFQVYTELIAYGYEGIIVRHIQAPYVRKRSTFVMKFKPKQEDTYEIVSAIEEVSIHGVPKNALGALICKGGDGAEFKVGTGFTRSMRESLWKRVETLKGKSLLVQYQHKTAGKEVPRFPVAKSIID